MMASYMRTSQARRAMHLVILTGLAAAISISGAGIAVHAQEAQPPAAKQTKAKAKAKAKAATQDANAGKKDPTVAQQQVDAGIASLQAGKADAAVEQFSAALSGGSLPSNLMARAHYQRGLAYRKQSKPALAISDLTHALWLKNGLTDTERADALQNRIAAYRDAGLPDQADAESARMPATRSAAEQAAPVSSTSSITVAKPAAGFAPTQEAQAPSGSGGLGNFFGSLFGGSSSSAAPSPVETKPPVQTQSAVSAWSAGTEVKPGPASRNTRATKASQPAATETLPWEQQTAPAAHAGPVKTAAAAGAGLYQLQVAQLRSAEEARAVAARLKQQFASELAGREASISTVNAGGFGTLHRVAFGPFHDPAEWKDLCPKLLSAGQDCQPLTQ